MQVMDNPNIEAAEYQRDTLAKTESREYLL